MTSAPGLLLVAARAASQTLLPRIGGPGLVHCCENPYDGIREMSRRRWAAVALTSGADDLPQLCRAARRLQVDAALFALCDPLQEPDLKGLLGSVLDDYFIYPPTRREVAQIRNAAAAIGSPRGPAADPGAGVLTPREFAYLTESARSVAALERGIVDVVSRRIGQPVGWADPAEAGPTRPLLLAVGQGPRVLVSHRQTAQLDAETASFISSVQDCLPALLVSARRSETLHRLAVTDYLTATYNRRYFYHLTDRILRQAAARNFNVTLLLYDIDDFKRYNDTYGYAAGDEILRDTAAMMKDITRAHDIVARIGGDEFAVLFWDADQARSPASEPPDTAYALADRFRRAVARHHFRSLGPEAVGALTISGGLASFGPEARCCRELLREANRALKAVKSSGKNAIQLVGAWEGNGRDE